MIIVPISALREYRYTADAKNLVSYGPGFGERKKKGGMVDNVRIQGEREEKCVPDARPRLEYFLCCLIKFL